MTDLPQEKIVFIAAGDLQSGMKLVGPPECPPLDVVNVEAIYPAMVQVHVMPVGIVNMYSWEPVALA